MRLLVIVIGLTILSCGNQERKKGVFETLYLNKFSIGDSMSVEYVDSSFYIILTGGDSVNGYTLGKYKIESDLLGTFFIEKNFADSSRIAVTCNSQDLIKYEFEGKTIELKKTTEKSNFNIVGTWTCLNCEPLPPSINSDSDETRVVTYLFRNDNTFEIEEEVWRGKGAWKVSKSGQLVILNKIYKTGDLIKADLLILIGLNKDTLTLKRKKKRLYGRFGDT